MEDHKINIDESKNKENKSAHLTNKEEWKEFEEFYEAHSLQLYGMNFPKDLAEKLYYKLKHEIFDSTRFFEVLDNQEEERFLLRSKMGIKKDFEVFLVDHCWTFKLRQFNEFCEKYPGVIDRVYNMLKYSHIKREIPVVENKRKSTEEVEPIEINQTISYIEFDDLDLENFESVMGKINPNVEALSIENNKIPNLDLVVQFLETAGKGIKAIWLNGNPFEEEEANSNYDVILAKNFPQLELINRKFTNNSSKWAVKFIQKKTLNSNLNKYNQFYGKEVSVDLSGRDPLNGIIDFSIFSEAGGKCKMLDIRDNYYNYYDKDIVDKLFELLKQFPELETIYVDESDQESMEENEPEEEKEVESDSFFQFINRDKNFETLTQICPNLKFVNEFSLTKLHSLTVTNSITRYQKECWVRKYMWKIIQTYRLMTSEKYDEDAIWYINDEIGSSINHSDSPNVALLPFIFSPSNTFKDDMITYSILWPLKDIRKEEEILRDYLTNISEIKQRSARLSCWFQTPKNYFISKFTDKVKEFSQKNIEKVLENYTEDMNTLAKLSDHEFFQIYKQTFNFDSLKNLIKENKLNPDIEENVKKNVEKTVTWKDGDLQIDEFFQKKFIEKNIKIKVFSDLPYVRENLNLEVYEITFNISEADIIWLNTCYFKVAENCGKELKKTSFKNQFPYENIITMKSHLTDLIQSNAGITSYFNLSYNMETELAQLIGNYMYNSDNNFDNSWILKPINMSRSMDMIVTNNFDEIIRSVETGPKICQKYMNRPLLLNGKKFDLRFIILLKRLVPLELYFYSKMFWVRSANKDFTMDSSTFTDYEVHFTVMNYNTFGMQTVYDKQFLEYLKSKNIEWDSIYEKIKKTTGEIFLLAGKDCPQMCDPYSRAIYGLDVMLDEDLNPKVLEINYSPDCTRAAKFVPEFFDDIFSTLFLHKPSGVELVQI